MFEYNFDEPQQVAQIVIGVRHNKITGVYICHPPDEDNPEGQWDKVVDPNKKGE